jgi:predicted nucleic acid-binding protein
VAFVVLDACVALAAVLPEELSPSAQAILSRVARDGAIVPAIWHMEVGGALLRAQRKGAITPEQCAAVLDDLARFPIVTDFETPIRAWHEIMVLAQQTRLSLFDAAYLELSGRSRLPLATLDRALRHAAERRGIDLV